MTTIRTPEDLRTASGTVTVTELATVIRCSDEYIRKLIDAGAIEYGRVGRHYRIPVDEARRIARESGALRR